MTEMKKCIELAEGIYPQVINNLTVGGQQQVQVQLHCKVFEFEADEAKITAALDAMSAGNSKSKTDDTVSVLLNGDAFDSIAKTLRKTLKVKHLASPTLTTVSGRPAAFSTGGEFPILIPQGPKTVAVEYKQFGTRIDFVPVTLGNDRLRLEVRPQISQIEPGNPPLMVGDSAIPRLNKRWADFAAEMNSGQTLAVAVVDKRPEGKHRCFMTLVRPELVSSVAANNVPSVASESVPMFPR